MEEVEELLRDLDLSPLGTSNDAAIPEDQSGQVHVSGQTLGQESLPVTAPDILNVLYGGASPLHIASEHGHATLVGLLLQYGADPTIR